MKIAYITGGAAGMFCGSCMHDNTLVTALRALGHDALLIPTYTPILTDEADVSERRVFFGGINVYLQQKFALFRHTPWSLDRLLDAPGLLRWVSRFAMRTRAEDLGELALSMLQGDHGHQSKEITKLADWLADDLKPDLINLSNILQGGMVHELKRRMKVPVLATLQGDDLFLQGLPESYRIKALDLAREHCRAFDGFQTTSGYYADFMAGYLNIPRERIHVIHPGLNLKGHGAESAAAEPRPFTIGYFARICPEKGLHVLIEAFHQLRDMPEIPDCRLRVSGYLGAGDKPYFAKLQKQIKEWGLADRFDYVESPDHASKVRFFQSLDVLSVPTTYREPKGLYILEALANGVPVVQPRHGSFPELIEATGGGLLVAPDDPADLARGLKQLMDDVGQRQSLGSKGKEVVHRHFHARRMAEQTAEVYHRYVGQRGMFTTENTEITEKTKDG